MAHGARGDRSLKEGDDVIFPLLGSGQVKADELWELFYDWELVENPPVARSLIVQVEEARHTGFNSLGRKENLIATLTRHLFMHLGGEEAEAIISTFFLKFNFN
jgi:hypothetical protein